MVSLSFVEVVKIALIALLILGAFKLWADQAADKGSNFAASLHNIL